MAKKPRLELELENCPPTSSFRYSINRRSSIISSYTINSKVKINNEVDEEDQNDALQCYIMRTPWNAYRVSPLFNFNYSKSQLKQYALKIKQYLTANVNITSILEYQIDVNIVDYLKSEVGHSDAIQIRVFNKSSSGEKLKLLYDCILLSWGSYNVQKENLTYLPILIDHGQTKIGSNVRLYLQKMFDCIIAPLSFTQTEMLFFAALLNSYSPKDGSKDVKYTYNVPIVPKTAINITIMNKFLYNMWLSCFPGSEPSKIINEKTSWKMYDIFHKYIQHTYEIDIGRLELVQIKYPSVELQSLGKIQLHDLEIARAMLSFICQISVILQSSTPSLETE